MSAGERTNIVRVTTATATTCNAIIVISVIIGVIFQIIYNDWDAALYPKHKTPLTTRSTSVIIIMNSRGKYASNVENCV